MRLSVLGSSGSSPVRDNAASGYLVETGAGSILLDAGSGTFAQLAKRMDPADLAAVVISHIHVDHCVDLFGLFAYLAYGPGIRSEPLPVYVPPGAAAHFEAFIRAGADHPWWSVLDLRTMSSGDTASIVDARLSFAEANHSVPNIATRVDVGGHSLVYTGDTGPSPTVADLTTGADVLVCEATYQEDTRDESFPFHLSAREAGAMAEGAGVDLLILTHLRSSLDVDQSVAEARHSFRGGVVTAQPGLALAIGDTTN